MSENELESLLFFYFLASGESDNLRSIDDEYYFDLDYANGNENGNGNGNGNSNENIDVPTTVLPRTTNEENLGYNENSSSSRTVIGQGNVENGSKNTTTQIVSESQISEGESFDSESDHHDSEIVRVETSPSSGLRIRYIRGPKGDPGPKGDTGRDGLSGNYSSSIKGLEAIPTLSNEFKK